MSQLVVGLLLCLLPAAPLEVEVSMEAAWPGAPLAAEMLEGLAEVGKGTEYLRALAKEARNAANARAWREAAARLAEAQVSGGGVFAQFLSLRARLAMASARVEAARGLERAARGLSGCPLGTPWASVAVAGMLAQAACGKELARLTTRLRRGGEAAVSKEHTDALAANPLDHVLYEVGVGSSAAVEVVGYVDLGSPTATATLLEALFGLIDDLSDQSRAGRVAVRHGVPAADAAAPATLAGYGVELLARSADEVTKSVDGDEGTSGAAAAGQHSDAPTEGSLGPCSNVAAGAADPAALFHGINLELLASRHPQAAPALCALHGDLRAAVESPPPPWELKRLGASAALRASRAAASSAGAGLAALQEAAQDFPSGWARALATGGADEALARELMDQAADISSGTFEVNGWQVPTARRSMVPLLHAHAPLFHSAELLAAAGFEPAAVVALLRDVRPGEPVPERIATDDPRLNGDDKGVDGPLVVYDVRTDPEAAQVRAQDKEQDERSRGFFPGPGALLRLVQYFGRFWAFPPPVPRQLYGVGLALDLCSSQQLGLLGTLLEQPAPTVVWLQLSTSRPAQAPLAALTRGALRALVEGAPGPPAARRLLLGLGDEPCSSGAEKRLKDKYTRLWKDVRATAPALQPEQEPTSGLTGLPLPSAVVNGRLLFGQSLLEEGALEMVCKDELAMLVRKLSMQDDLGFTASDEEVARWQYGASTLSLWHPVLVPERTSLPRYAPVPADQLRGLPWAVAMPPTEEEEADTTLAVHVLVLGDPMAPSVQEDEAAEEEAAQSVEEEPLVAMASFLEAYSEHLKGAGSSSSGAQPSVIRLLFPLIAGGCPLAGAPLSLAGALRRCLVAALPRVGDSAGSATVLAGLARAWRSTTTVEGTLAACVEEAKVHGGWAEPEALRLADTAFTSADAALCSAQRSVEGAVGPVPAGAASLLVNGRRHGPLFPVQGGMRFQAAHLGLAEQLELAHGPKLSGLSAASWSTTGLALALRAANPQEDLLNVAYALAVCARTVQEVQAVRSGASEGEMQEDGAQARPQEDERGFAPVQRSFLEAPEGLRLHLRPREGMPCPLQIFAALDPLGQDAQRLPPVLRLLHEELNAEVGVVLCPRPLVAPPLMGFYRAAPVPRAPPGGLASLGLWDGSVPKVQLSLPPRRGLMLSAQLSTPQAWLCSAVDSGGADLDSLRAELGGTVQARYVLEALFVEGWADQGQGRRGAPAAGRQLALAALGWGAGGAENTAGRDSVVVKSGYFQLRAPPGLYQLALQSGKEDEQLLWPKGAVELADLAGRSTLLHARVGPRASGPGAAAGVAAGPASQVSLPADAYDGAGGDLKVCKETMHIFSVASGHRYERLLRIMMLSVREHTKCPLRFWLVDNFLSPNFRRILPSLARRVGFAVSSVTYKWPTWLRAQKEKQRVIWAYKILFLDVYFPRQVQRVLFIDADQIVRADVKELWDMDLKDSVYGFVPFCGSGPRPSTSLFGWTKEEVRNPETLGFRFWEQGFWQKHLGSDRYYHISALFVVNLKLFRSTGAGDILRDVYQSLTEDPGSLANLDQDLPNYVQHNLPIFSLPPEWLWCETWCSNETKARAKTIDMCQNPVRKEGKLQQARRIAPEWVQYDAKLERWVHEALAQEGAAVA